MGAESRLQALGIELPEPPKAGGNYVSWKKVGSLVYMAGVISMHRELVIAGAVGSDRSVEEGYSAARACGMTQLAVLKAALGSLDAVEQVVSVNGYVNAVAGFAESPQVVNGFSDLMMDVFGEAGRHVRAAVAVNGLPRNALVEVQMVVAVKG